MGLEVGPRGLILFLGTCFVCQRACARYSVTAQPRRLGSATFCIRLEARDTSHEVCCDSSTRTAPESGAETLLRRCSSRYASVQPHWLPCRGPDLRKPIPTNRNHRSTKPSNPNKALEMRPSPILPAIIAGAGEKAGKRFIEFLTATIRIGNTREAYARAIGDFFAWAAWHRPPDTNRHRAGACRRLHRAVDESPIGPDGQAAPRRHPHVLRLADQRRGHGFQPGQLGTRPQARRARR